MKGCEVNSGLDPTPKLHTPETVTEFAMQMKNIREETQAALKRYYNKGYKPEEYKKGEKV